MVFKVPAAAGHLKKNRFEFEFDGKVESLPKLDYVPPEGDDYIAELNGKALPTREYVLGFIEAIDPDLGKRMRDARMARDQVAALYDAWRAASKVDEGESSGSDDS